MTPATGVEDFDGRGFNLLKESVTNVLIPVCPYLSEQSALKSVVFQKTLLRGEVSSRLHNLKFQMIA